MLYSKRYEADSYPYKRDAYMGRCQFCNETVSRASDGAYYPSLAPMFCWRKIVAAVENRYKMGKPTHREECREYNAELDYRYAIYQRGEKRTEKRIEERARELALEMLEEMKAS